MAAPLVILCVKCQERLCNVPPGTRDAHDQRGRNRFRGQAPSCAAAEALPVAYLFRLQLRLRE